MNGHLNHKILREVWTSALPTSHIVRKRLLEISDLIDALVSQGCTAHQAEAKAIEQIRKLGSEILREWGQKAESAAVSKACAEDPKLRDPNAVGGFDAVGDRQGVAENGVVSSGANEPDLVERQAGYVVGIVESRLGGGKDQGISNAFLVGNAAVLTVALTVFQQRFQAHSDHISKLEIFLANLGHLFSYF